MPSTAIAVRDVAHSDNLMGEVSVLCGAATATSLAASSRQYRRQVERAMQRRAKSVLQGFGIGDGDVDSFLATLHSVGGVIVGYAAEEITLSESSSSETTERPVTPNCETAEDFTIIVPGPSRLTKLMETGRLRQSFPSGLGMRGIFSRFERFQLPRGKRLATLAVSLGFEEFTVLSASRLHIVSVRSPVPIGRKSPFKLSSISTSSTFKDSTPRHILSTIVENVFRATSIHECRNPGCLEYSDFFSSLQDLTL
ncbi:hypothetical protein NMY22_g268 [Coprinellus aureogranulatus]|nr:hypothetical protein NMY22_g268 [Coprinellus aureogranulatus]